MHQEKLLKNINKLYRDDELINQMLSGIGCSLDDWSNARDDVAAQFDFDKMTWGISLWENLLDIKTDANKPFEDRRSAIKARWRSDGKSDTTLIQSIADSWKNGEVAVSFLNGKIMLNFNSTIGVPKDLNTLIGAVSDVSPAHLMVEYVLNYLLIRDVEAMTLNQLELQPLTNFAF